MLILLYWLYAFFSSHSTVLLCLGHMHTSPSLFSRKFIPPFSLLLIGLIALLVKCWDLLLQRFETAPCNVYLPDMAEITCLHHTWSAHLHFGAGRLGWVWALVLRGGVSSFPNWVAKGESIQEPGGNGCPTPVEIFRFIHGIPIGSKNCWGWERSLRSPTSHHYTCMENPRII